MYSTLYAIHGARHSAPCIRHNFITIARTKTPTCELHYFNGAHVALFRVRRILLTDRTFKSIGGSQAPRRCLSSEAAAR
jgi:hypothetical protein